MAVQVREMLVERDASDLKQVKNAVESLLEDTDKSGQAVSMEGARRMALNYILRLLHDGISTSVSTTNEDMQSDEEVDSSRLSQRPPSPVQASQLSDDDEAYNDSDSAVISLVLHHPPRLYLFQWGQWKNKQRGPPWLSTHALVTNDPDTDPGLLTSVQDLRNGLRLHFLKANTAQSHVFIGVVDASPTLLQYNTHVYVVSHEVLVKEFFYQRVLFNLGHFTRSETPLHVKDLLNAAIDAQKHLQGSAALLQTEVQKSEENMAALLADENRRAMLADYFQRN